MDDHHESTAGPSPTDWQPVLDEIAASCRPAEGEGEVAQYIPALAEIDPGRFGIALVAVDGEVCESGDSRMPFSIQSVSKVFTLTLAIRYVDDALWERVGREPSGDPFNSLVQLEHEAGRPRNPLINPGAICVADLLLSHCADAKRTLLDFVSNLAGEPISFDFRVAESERRAGHRNAAMAHFLKSFGRLDNPVDAVLDLYYHQCAIAMDCVQLARAFGYLANHGVAPASGERVTGESQTRRINALMLTCGTYDEAGEFAFRVGLPCKSGVGGAIVAVVPERMSLAVWSPALGASGNSLGGFRALTRFTDQTGLSVF